jgi:DNA (cytosine-5)-methyltransferase 1
VILDLFAGPGGWSEGIRELGQRDIGIEIDAPACATRAAAGHLTIRADVTTYPLEVFADRAEGLIASPPCKDFSRAGKRKGLAGDSGRLVFEVMRWSKALRPLWIACEQVPDVLPVWQEFAWELRRLGYSTWTGILCAADYGVPQTRQRAFLLAHLERPALPPEPTHCRGGRAADLFGRELLPWVSMAEALGWGLLGDPSPVVMTARNRQTGHDVLRGSSWRAEWFRRQQSAGNWTLHTNRDQRPNGDRQTVTVDRPAPSVTGKSGGQWVLRNNTNANACARTLDEPAGTLFFGSHLNDVSWVAERPSTTVCADARIGRPGHKDRSQGEAQFALESVRVSIEEAAILQGFRPDYPWQGTKTKRFEQVGNAVPPPLAAAIVRALVETA